MRGLVVFVDRDGVLNEDRWGYVTRWEEFSFYKGVLEGLKRLTGAGYKIVLISNQAGVGDGIFSEEAFWKVHDKMVEVFIQKGIRLSAAYYCLHGKEAGCDCRKPKTGLFRQAQEALDLDLERSETYFVGDKAADVEAGKNFGLRTILVRTGYGKEQESLCRGPLQPDATVDGFREAVDLILKTPHSSRL